MIIPSCRCGNILSFIVLCFTFYTHVPIFRRTQLDALFSKCFEFKLFVIVAYHWICIDSHYFIIRFFRAYHEYLCLKYEFSYPLIWSILILPWPGELINLSIINLYIKTKTANIHIGFSHLYYLLHQYLVSCIIPPLMNKLL